MPPSGQRGQDNRRGAQKNVLNERRSNQTEKRKIITKLPIGEWRELQKYRGYVMRRNACCCTLGNDWSCCDRQDYLEAKLEACHNGGWDVEKDTPAAPEGKEGE